jgi:hypothetical protein
VILMIAAIGVSIATRRKTLGGDPEGWPEVDVVRSA